MDFLRDLMTMGDEIWFLRNVGKHPSIIIYDYIHT
jgi:hypothetical protein